MTCVGAGGLRITKVTFKPRFQRDRRKLPPEIRERLNEKLKSLYQDPMPPGLRFEKLKGYSRPTSTATIRSRSRSTATTPSSGALPRITRLTGGLESREKGSLRT